MTLEELANALNKMYTEAKEGEKATMIHLFGVKYAAKITASGVSKKDIAIAAGIDSSYGTEINKGVNLAKYVRVK